MSASAPRAAYWQRVRELFLACASLNAADRATLLQRECDDAEIRDEVTSLLEQHDATGEFLEESIWQLASDAASRGDAPSDDPASVGPYRIVRRIGQGGMGTVLLGVRDDADFEQRVAIKLVAAAGGSEMIRRFRQERQILAALAHPHIARLLDGGTTANGLPYLVMEYVEGTPIDVDCRERALPVAARLQLFLELCDAVQYAHRNLIIHRDLKPGNVLVTNDGVVKLLDFGIAKLTSEETRVDATVTRLMTPDYASPEQLDGRLVTTASDVYSLGVLLFQLLTDTKPFRGPTRGDAPRASSVTRQRALRGDLDRIIAVALDADPERRYGSVENFAADIRRHLDGRPVTARGASLGYRTAKFVRRNKLFAGAAAVALLVIVGAFFAILQQKRIAERRFEQVRSLAHSVVFDIHDAIAPLRGSTAARRLLVQRALVYLDALAKESADNTPLELELAGAYQRVGDVQGLPYLPNLGDGNGALTSYRKAQSIAERVAAREPENTTPRLLLAELHDRAGFIEQRALRFKAAIADHEAARALREAIPNRGIAADLAQARTWVAIGDCLYLSRGLQPVTHGDTTVEGAYETALAIAARIPPDGPHRDALLVQTARAHQRLGGYFTGTWARDPKRALAHHEASMRALEERTRLNPANSVARRNYADQLVMTATLQNSIGDAAAALQGTTRALAILQELANADPDNVEAQHDLAFAHEQLGAANGGLGRWKECDESLAEAMRIRQKLVAADANNFEDRRGIAGLYGQMASWARRRGLKEKEAEYTAKGNVVYAQLKR